MPFQPLNLKCNYNTKHSLFLHTYFTCTVTPATQSTTFAFIMQDVMDAMCKYASPNLLNNRTERNKHTQPYK